MTTKALLSWIDSFDSTLTENQYLWDAIRQMAAIQVEISKKLEVALPLGGSPAGTQEAMNVVREKLRVAMRDLRTLSVFRIFNQVTATIAALERLETSPIGAPTKHLERLRKLLGEYGAAHEGFITLQDLPATWSLLSTAQRVAAAIGSWLDFAAFAKGSLGLNPDPSTVEGERLEIYLSGQAEFRQFLQKATALEEIYSEICVLINVSAAQEPLRIVKVESGSVWAWLKGNPKASALIAALLGSAARFIYRNHTDEGRLSTIPDKVEKIQAVLQLSDELRRRGISTEGLDAQISKASVKIGAQLERLLEGEEQIEINGEIHPLTPNQQQKLIAAKQVKLIAERSPDESGAQQ